MLRFVKEYMADIDGVAVFPVIALLLFSVFFVGLLWRAFSLKKKEIDYLKNIPLDD